MVKLGVGGGACGKKRLRTTYLPLQQLKWSPWLFELNVDGVSMAARSWGKKYCVGLLSACILTLIGSGNIFLP